MVPQPLLGGAFLPMRGLGPRNGDRDTAFANVEDQYLERTRADVHAAMEGVDDLGKGLACFEFMGGLVLKLKPQLAGKDVGEVVHWVLVPSRRSAGRDLDHHRLHLWSLSRAVSDGCAIPRGVRFE